MTAYGYPYHGYWTRDLYSLNSRFGTANDLKNLVKALHDRGMYIMVDITINSNGAQGNHANIDYSIYNPFNSANNYHPWCWIDYANQTSVTQCWLGDDTVPLPDLDTENAGVASKYQSWAQNLISTYDLDGLRLDALKHVSRPFWPPFQKAIGAFAMGEAYQADPAMACVFQTDGLDAVLNFPVYYGLLFAFNATGGGMDHLVGLIESVAGNCSDTSVLGTFLENHDLPRYAGITSDQYQLSNALAYLFTTDGIPVVYYGQEQGFTGQQDPYNREALWTSGYDTTNPLYQVIRALNTFRSHVIAGDPTWPTTKMKVLTNDITTIVIKKGEVLSILNNEGIYGSNATITIKNTGYPPNTKLIEVLSRTSAAVDGSGNLKIQKRSGAPQVISLATVRVLTYVGLLSRIQV